MFVEALFVIAPNWKKPSCPSAGEWLNHPYHGTPPSNPKKQMTVCPAT